MVFMIPGVSWWTREDSCRLPLITSLTRHDDHSATCRSQSKYEASGWALVADMAGLLSSVIHVLEHPNAFCPRSTVR